MRRDDLTAKARAALSNLGIKSKPETEIDSDVAAIRAALDLIDSDEAWRRRREIIREANEARDYAHLDLDESDTWERDLERSIAAAQRALVLLRERRT